MIILSRNEIRAEIEKAIRGAGANWGQAKDGGVMAAYLAGHGLPFLGTVTRCLDGYDSQAETDHLIAPLNGIMTAEYVAGTAQPWSGPVMAIRFLVAAMGIVADEQETSLCLYDDAGVLAYAEGAELFIRSHSLEGGLAHSLEGGLAHSLEGGDRRLRLTAEACATDQLDQCPWLQDTAVHASSKCWQKLGSYAFKTYVKETEEKRRAGAGAGDIDNS
ncbi:MAG: DUF3726 domain-containing protein [Alphaproteobacteria bacterium]|nr:DUF3726 domain-containing protein [Alphaproteobacteria bacterium]